MKLARRRERPDRPLLGVPESRWVLMPTSTSFPSGHSASAAAFAVAVGHLLPWTRWPLRSAAATVAFSRVYTGVHYPGDVVIGAAVGALLGAATARVTDLVVRKHAERSARAADAARHGLTSGSPATPTIRGQSARLGPPLRIIRTAWSTLPCR